MEYVINEYSNGIRSVFVPESFNNICHVALTIKVGTTQETPETNGMAHFIEHTLFKGTQKRKAYHILSRIDSVGGELNAFTTKEETCLYISVHNNYLERAFELLSDIFYNSLFPEEELLKEKEVIKDEIRMYLDTPSEQIYDDFEQLIFKNHPLGLGILGTEQTVNNIKRKDVLNFYNRYYTTKNLVISGSTPSGVNAFKAMIEKYFSIPKKTQRTIHAKKSHRIVKRTFQSDVVRAVNQAHCIMGSFAYKRDNPKRTALVLLNNLLGGQGMNSLLNLNIREKYGYTYQIESAYQAYTQTGIFSIYYSTELNRKEKTHQLILNELNKLSKNKLSITRLHAAKRQYIGQLTLSRENVLSLVLGAGKSLLHRNKVDTFDEILKRIETVTAQQLLETANEIFDTKQLCVLNYLPQYV